MLSTSIRLLLRTSALASLIERVKDWSILMMSTGKAIEIAQRRIAGAEVVERDAAAELADVADDLANFRVVVHQHRFGDLDDDALRGCCGA
jgi:hypothetical protein